MSLSIEAESTLTDRYQTTIPEAIRLALGLNKRDKIHYTIRDNGEVVLTKHKVVEGDDPLLNRFLTFLAGDIHSHPEHLRAVDVKYAQKAQVLLDGVEADLDVPLLPEDE